MNYTYLRYAFADYMKQQDLYSSNGTFTSFKTYLYYRFGKDWCYRFAKLDNVKPQIVGLTVKHFNKLAILINFDHIASDRRYKLPEELATSK